jgi:23S rRNA pseudouridine2605 synthase
MQQETLLKALIKAGLGSRRQLANIIREGRVTINGELVDNFSHLLNLGSDIIQVDEKPVKLKRLDNVVLMVNKPTGILSTTKDDSGRRTIIDLLPSKYHALKLYPVGRLDKDSTGLLLLTNDGDLTYKLTHPKFEHEKEYLINTKAKLKPDEKLRIEKGIELDDGITYPAVLKEITNHQMYQYSITIHEGRNRQIRRMFARLGINIIGLKRIRIGGLTLGNLREGDTRELNASEMQKLFQKH